MQKVRDLKWFAYLHINGGVQLKRFMWMSQIDDAQTSSFVQKVTLPFKAENREDAMSIAEERLLSKKITEDEISNN